MQAVIWPMFIMYPIICVCVYMRREREGKQNEEERERKEERERERNRQSRECSDKQLNNMFSHAWLQNNSWVIPPSIMSLRSKQWLSIR